VPVSSGFLQLGSGSIKVLGGKVEALFDKWEISQKLAQFTKLRSARPQVPIVLNSSSSLIL
jgi:hypothetical protein